ncbi:MAG TPA: hypothetical protein VE953_11990 [Terriglobales bacterium]|nr:hypothetical protein [Terriglobales bacterium]
MPRAYQPTPHALTVTNATRCADLVRIAGAVVLSPDLLERGYADLWYAYAHAERTARALRAKGRCEAAGKWQERADSYRIARAALWAELVRRGLRTEAPYVGVRLLPNPAG